MTVVVNRTIDMNPPAFDTDGFIRNYVNTACEILTPTSDGNKYHDFVTQTRHHATNYSSCGDLWNVIPWMLGCMEPSIVNRDDSDIGLVWHPGENISRTYNGARAWKAWVPYAVGVYPKSGDMMLIGEYPHELEHVFVVSDFDESTNILTSYDFGDFRNGKKCSTRNSRTWRNNRLYSTNGKSRSIIGWIDITKIPLNRLAVDLESFKQGD